MDRIVQFILQKRALAFAIIACTAVSLGSAIVLHRRFGDDFAMYYRVANEPLSMAYLPYSDLPFPYLPTMILWVAPLAHLPLWPSYLLWIAVSAGALVLACRRYLCGSAITLALVSPPMVFCYLTGQVSALLAALLIWACGTPHRVAAGLSFAVIASIKPQIVIMAPLLMLFQKDWRALSAAITTFCLLVLASLLAFGLDTWFVWLASLDDFRHMFNQWGVFNFAVTPAAIAESFGIMPLPILMLGAACGAWLAFRCRNQSSLIQSAAVAAGSLMAAPYALVHDLAPVVPFLAWSVIRGRFAAAVAMSGALQPLPLVLTALGLMKEAGRRVTLGEPDGHEQSTNHASEGARYPT